MREVTGLRVLTAVAVVMAGASVALGVGITSIGVLDPGSGVVQSKVYAISPDGMYAVGGSQGQRRDLSDTLSQAVVWSAASGLVQLPNDPPEPYIEYGTVAKGVVVKDNGDVGIATYYYSTDRGTGNPILDSYRMNHYTASPSDLGNGTHVMSEQKGGPAIGMYNAARMYENGSGNDWTIAGQRAVGGRGIISMSYGGYSDSGTLADYTRIYNVASRVPTGSGRGFGAGIEKYNPTGFVRATFGISGSTQFLIPGTANGTAADLQSASLGMSPYTTYDAGTGVIVGYDADVDGTARAFYYEMAGFVGSALNGQRVLLAEPAGADTTQAIDVRVIDGKMIICGFATYGDTEQAIIWDQTGTWMGANSGTPRSVMTLLNNAGLDVSEWSSLSRVTSMSDDGWTIGGWGIWAADGSTRGFVATIPEPASLLLLSLGGFALLRRTRR